MTIRHATSNDAAHWDAYIAAQRFRPFLQSWAMGDVYADTKQEPIRFLAEEHGNIVGVCLAIIVPARRGRHLAIPYGPLGNDITVIVGLLQAVCSEAKRHACTFVRFSPFLPAADAHIVRSALREGGMNPTASPLHLLAEHVWYLPLRSRDPWTEESNDTPNTEEELMAHLRKTTRNLVRRAEKDGVTVRTSTQPVQDVEEFIRLHDETRKRHKFTPYTNAFFHAQVKHFAARGECTVYLAEYEGKIIAASVHMHAFGETSYHHGASDSAHHKIPASYLLQWTAIRDALKRGDRIYNFWGIAPMDCGSNGERTIGDKNHPFAGVTLFKTGFGGSLLDLHPCTDLPLSSAYRLTRTFEILRKWKRGF